MRKFNILIIEDEEAILLGISDDLNLEGFDVTGIMNGSEGLHRALNGCFDLIILDIMLPDLNGFEILKRLRHEDVITPVILLTAKKEEIDRVLGLELGADDYIVKPFSRRELIARVKSRFRRMHNLQTSDEKYEFADVKIDFRNHEAWKKDHPVCFTAREYDLLALLIRHQNESLSRDQILDSVWGKNLYVTPRTVDTHIAHLRKKIEDDSLHPKHILGVHGMGYRFKP